MTQQQVVVLSDYSPSVVKNIVRSQTNKPELRQELIHKYLKERNEYMMIIPEMVITKKQVERVHDAKYVEFLQNVWKSWMDSDKDIDYERDGGIAPYHFSRRWYDIPKELPYWKRMGFYCDDSSTPIHSHTYDIAMTSANNCVVAAQMINTKNTNPQVIYCLNTFPGHHACYDGYGGYCFFNNPAICAAELMTAVDRVAILDVDYHAGNGSQRIFEKQHNVLTVSIHADPAWDYPTYVGFPSENHSSNVNIIFPKKATYQQYKPLLESATQMIKEFKPDVLVVALGVDTLAGDPDASKLYGCALEVTDFTTIGKIVGTCCKKVVVTQEGGYDMANVPQAVHNFLTGLAVGTSMLNITSKV